MTSPRILARLITILTALVLVVLDRSWADAEDQSAGSSLLATDGPVVYRVSLEEAKQRALANSRLRSLAYMNFQAKQEGVYVMEADYYPKLLANFTGFHFDLPLGKVLVPRPPLPSVAVNVFDQDFGMASLTAVQPITALLKVRQGVVVTEADQRIAQSQAQQADRAIASGVEQLYCGLLAANRILAAALAAAEAAAKMPPAVLQMVDARVAAVEAKQAIQAVSVQAGELEEQLNGMLDLPLTTKLELVELPAVEVPVYSADQAMACALSCSPEVFQAEQDTIKAEAAVKLAKVDYLPDVMFLGGYVNQNGLNVIQNDFSYAAVTANYTLFAGGKRVHAVRQAETVVAMARQKACQTRDEVRLKAQKAFREYQQARESLKTAREMVLVRSEAQQTARSPEDMIKAAGESMKAQAAVVQAEATFRVAGVKLTSITGF
jgi:outer membrane protein TolC